MQTVGELNRVECRSADPDPEAKFDPGSGASSIYFLSGPITRFQPAQETFIYIQIPGRERK